VALFTNKADQNRPMLTKVCQLDLDNTPELVSFFYSIGDTTSAEALEELADEESFISKKESYIDDLKRYYDTTIKDFTSIQDTMRSISEKNSISIEILFLLNGISRTVRYATSIESPVRPWKKNGEINLNHLKCSISYAPSGVNPTAIKAFIDLGNIIQEFIKSGVRQVATCPECDKPFVIAGGAGGRRGDGALYCSYRCDHRAKGRERYSALFSDRKTL
jgi:hypothetical protein